MTKKVLLLHGWGGSDFPHWQSWLAGEIAKDYGEVCFLKFDNFDTPKLSIWKEQLQEKLQSFQPDIVICHSLANTLWMHLCHTNSLQELEYLYLVAPPSFTCKIQELQEFFPLVPPSNLYAKNTLLICSDNDPYMTLEEAHSLEKTLNIKMVCINNGGHLNAESNYGEWPWILQEIKSKINP
jgi:predicted alpha/beta hydrolase family esterase